MVSKHETNTKQAEAPETEPVAEEKPKRGRKTKKSEDEE